MTPLTFCSGELDFLGTIRLVNYIRSEVKRGNTTPDLSSKQLFESEDCLQSVLEDDALLFSLGDFEDDTASDDDTSDSTSKLDVSSTRTFNSVEMARIIDTLKHKYDDVSAKLSKFTGRMKQGLTTQYETHGFVPGRRWSTANMPLSGDVSPLRNGSSSRPPINFLNPIMPSELPARPNRPSRGEASDDHYFQSYAETGMHY